MSEREILKCGDCGSFLELIDFELGGSRRKRWACSRRPECRGGIGAHPDGRPLGIPADEVTRAARIVAHAAFDVLWKNGRVSRGEAYRLLARELGVDEVHIGDLNQTDCKRVVEAAMKLSREFALRGKPCGDCSHPYEGHFLFGNGAASDGHGSCSDGQGTSSACGCLGFVEGKK